MHGDLSGRPRGRFQFFGAVPIRISYDNTSIAVSKIIGNERELTRGFLTLESHHLFDHHFCHVGRGNEKGHVENHVGYSRRNLLVPVPSFPSWAALNEYLAAACYADLFRRVRGKVGTKAERLEDDRAAMLALPAETSSPAGWLRAMPTRSLWCDSTAMTTRCRRPMPITR